MNPDELASRLKDLGYGSLLETIKAVDPDLYEVVAAIALVRNSKYGNVSVEVYNGKITLIIPSIKIHLKADK